MSLRHYGKPEDRVYERAEILAALEEARGRVANVTVLLGVCRRRVYKYLHRFDLWDDLERIRQESVVEDAARVDVAERTLAALVPAKKKRPTLGVKATSRTPVWWKTRKG